MRVREGDFVVWALPVLVPNAGRPFSTLDAPVPKGGGGAFKDAIAAGAGNDVVVENDRCATVLGSAKEDAATDGAIATTPFPPDCALDEAGAGGGGFLDPALLLRY